ncbi:MAG: hypothetical protein EXR20_09360 [Bacteroidetes bacterium]|nr:hypothetical protein [Bacteroidota bacterium]
MNNIFNDSTAMTVDEQQLLSIFLKYGITSIIPINMVEFVKDVSKTITTITVYSYDENGTLLTPSFTSTK